MFCDTCLDERDADVTESDESFHVRGEEIVIRARVPVCKVCRHTISHPEIDNENLLQAYRKYRRRHNLLQPEEIAAIRAKYGLSQRAMARLLGWGPITIQRYERGALQDTSHNYLMQSMRDPRFVLGLLGVSTCKLTETEKKTLEASILGESAVYLQERSMAALEDWLVRDEPSEYTGFCPPSLERLGKMMVYFAHRSNGPLFKVKLMKLLFYSDFLHFARHRTSISGFPYARLNMGPVPDRFQQILAWLEGVGYGRLDDVPTGLGMGEALIPLAPADLQSFSDEEAEDMNAVWEMLSDKSGAELKDISHREPAWLNTPHKERISYRWAEHLKAIPVSQPSPEKRE
jgi:putative zinc finger/helix-turn-helix YgiT family protein